MPALIVELADAIVADLREQDFEVVIPWERSYGDWDIELKDIGTLHGDVVPVFDGRVDLETRGSVRYELLVDLAIRMRFDSQKDINDAGRVHLEEIDKLVLAIQQVQQHVVIGSYSESRWNAATPQDIQAFYVKKHLREWNQFTGIVRVPYETNVEL